VAGDSVKYEQLGKARLSLVDAVAQSVGFMGPVFVSALILPLIVAAGAAGKGAGVATPFVVILTAIGIAASVSGSGPAGSTTGGPWPSPRRSR